MALKGLILQIQVLEKNILSTNFAPKKNYLTRILDGARIRLVNEFYNAETYRNRSDLIQLRQEVVSYLKFLEKLLIKDSQTNVEFEENIKKFISSYLQSYDLDVTGTILNQAIAGITNVSDYYNAMDSLTYNFKQKRSSHIKLVLTNYAKSDGTPQNGEVVIEEMNF